MCIVYFNIYASQHAALSTIVLYNKMLVATTKIIRNRYGVIELYMYVYRNNKCEILLGRRPLPYFKKHKVI